MNIKIKYRVDKRIRVVEITTGTKKFLVGLQDFSEETGITDFDENTTGVTAITGEAYSILWGDRIK